MLFYLMIKNHPFQNGNKRIAMTTLFVFLYLNRKWLKVDSKELYNFAVWVAQSPAKLKDETVKAIEKSAGFLRLDEAEVDIPRILQSGLNGLASDFVKNESLPRHLGLEHLTEVPANRFTLAITSVAR